MLKKITVGVSALAMTAFAGSAMAQTPPPYLIYNPNPAVVEIEIQVEPIAVLEVIKPGGKMLIDDDSDNTMGNPTSAIGSGPINTDSSDYAHIRLSSNFQVNNIVVDFDRTNDIRRREDPNWPASSATFNGTGYDYFGQATGPGGNTLGVFPQAIPFDGGPTLSSATIHYHDFGGNGPITIPGPAAGVQHYALGVSTNWSRTLLGEPVLAVPGTYTIELTATIVP